MRLLQVVFLCFCLASLFVFQVVAVYLELYSSRLHHCVDRAVPRDSCSGIYLKDALDLGVEAVTRYNPARAAAAEEGGFLPSQVAGRILAPLAWVPPESVYFDNQLEFVTALGMVILRLILRPIPVLTLKLMAKAIRRASCRI